MTVLELIYRIATMVASNMSLSILLPCILFAGLCLACHDEPPLSTSTEYTEPNSGDTQDTLSRYLFTPPVLGDMALTLESIKSSYRLGEPLALRVVVTNYDQEYWVLLPTFFPEGASPPDFPLSELRFEIENEYGIPVDRVSSIGQLPLFKTPSLCSLMVLPHGCLFGRVIVINEGFFAYAFPVEEGGVYTIRAVLRVFAHAFVRRQLSSGEPPLQCKTFAIERVYNGKMVSNPITIEYGGVPLATGISR